jgi:hypothetical protein
MLLNHLTNLTLRQERQAFSGKYAPLRRSACLGDQFDPFIGDFCNDRLLVRRNAGPDNTDFGTFFYAFRLGNFNVILRYRLSHVFYFDKMNRRSHFPVNGTFAGWLTKDNSDQVIRSHPGIPGPVRVAQ